MGTGDPAARPCQRHTINQGICEYCRHGTRPCGKLTSPAQAGPCDHHWGAIGKETVDGTLEARLSCRCGEVQRRGRQMPRRKTVNRVVCYCDDCQTFLHQLGRADLLDAPGRYRYRPGCRRAIARPSPSGAGSHRGTCALTPKGLLRWHTTCCNTPVGNTLGARDILSSGIVAQTFDDDAQRADGVFGAPIGAYPWELRDRRRRRQASTGINRSPCCAAPSPKCSVGALRGRSMAASVLRARQTREHGSIRLTRAVDTSNAEALRPLLRTGCRRRGDLLRCSRFPAALSLASARLRRGLG